MMDNYIEKRKNLRVVIDFREYKDKEFLDIREYYPDETGEWKPSNKGVTIPKEKICEFIEKINKYFVEGVDDDEKN